MSGDFENAWYEIIVFSDHGRSESFWYLLSTSIKVAIDIRNSWDAKQFQPHRNKNKDTKPINATTWLNKRNKNLENAV